ncbi:MAG: hypothetical protein H7Z41_14195 [Cytophagales bacterium]|nr:hypothetical protein [Armatimonadota bacterium]
MAVLGLLAIGTATPGRAQAPTVSYSPEAGAEARQLIFVNNPERLEIGYTDVYNYTVSGTVFPSVTQGVTFYDLADPNLGQKSVLQMTLAAGKYRDTFEHVWNFSRATVPASAANPIAYGVQIFNPNSYSIRVTLAGRGFRTGFAAGQPYLDLFAEKAQNPLGTRYTVRPGRSLWLMRTDVDYGTRPINSGNFFSGVLDFDVEDGPSVVTHLAYQNLRALTNWSDMGYVPRTNSNSTTPAPESRVYKGLMTYPDQAGGGFNTPAPGSVVTNLRFTVGSGTPSGEMPVQYPRYENRGDGTFVPLSNVTSGTAWFTHNIPSRNSNVVASDMFDINMPGFGTVFALAPTTRINTGISQGNIANWGVTYHDSITVTNNDTRDRTFALTLNNNGGGGSPIAYLDGTGIWKITTLNTVAFSYYPFTVAPGETKTVDGYFVLGCPAVGTLRHAVRLLN